jgi:hypothetical protein
MKQTLMALYECMSTDYLSQPRRWIAKTLLFST